MSGEEKSPWQTDRKCPRCKTLLRLQSVTETDRFLYEQVLCGMCGFMERTKTPLGVPMAQRTEPPKEAPRYGFRMARRLPKEDKGE